MRPAPLLSVCVQQLLTQGRIVGAQRVGRSLAIPAPVQLLPWSGGPVGVAGHRCEAVHDAEGMSTLVEV